MGYKFQFVTPSGFHALNYSTVILDTDFKKRGIAAYADLQAHEFEEEKTGYEATKEKEQF